MRLLSFGNRYKGVRSANAVRAKRATRFDFRTCARIERQASRSSHEARSLVLSPPKSTMCSNPPPKVGMTENTPEPIHQDRLWSDERWTARVVKNEDDDGWAVAM